MELAKGEHGVVGDISAPHRPRALSTARRSFGFHKTRKNSPLGAYTRARSMLARIKVSWKHEPDTTKLPQMHLTRAGQPMGFCSKKIKRVNINPRTTISSVFYRDVSIFDRSCHSTTFLDTNGTTILESAIHSSGLDFLLIDNRTRKKTADFITLIEDGGAIFRSRSDRAL